MRLKHKNSCLSAICLSLVLFTSQLWAQKPKYPVPEAKYDVRVERSIMIPMRDGVRLSTDLYFPVGAVRPCHGFGPLRCASTPHQFLVRHGSGRYPLQFQPHAAERRK